jgi:hypothetical protein
MEKEPRFVDETPAPGVAELMPFRQAAMAFAVMDMSTPLGHVESLTPGDDVGMQLMVEEHNAGRCDYCILAQNGKKTTGAIFFEDLRGHIEVDEDIGPGFCLDEDPAVIRPISINTVIPANTPMLDMVDLFASNDTFFLLTGNQITHIVRFGDCDRLPFRMCLLILLMELESAMTSALLRYGSTEETVFARLPEKRRTKARELLEAKQRELKKVNPKYTVQRGDLLQCTYMIDKATMIENDPKLLERLSSLGVDGLHESLKQLENLRNELAHGGAILRIFSTATELRSGVGLAERAIALLAAY